jgi:hypothetical protein
MTTPFKFNGKLKNVKFKIIRYRQTPEDLQNKAKEEMTKQ